MGSGLKRTLDYFKQSHKIKEKYGNKYAIGGSLVNIGNIYSHKGDYDTAQRYYDRSLKIQAELSDNFSMGAALIGIGNLYWQKRDYNKALDYFRKSLKIRKKIVKDGKPEMEIRMIMGVGLK